MEIKDNLSSFELSTMCDERENSLQLAINNLSTVEQEILLISRQIIDLQGKKKDLEYTKSKASQNKQVIESELRVLRSLYFKTQREGR